MKKKGFTLVELLAVIVVLSIVLMIAVAGYQKYLSYTKEKAFSLEEKNFLSAARSAYADCLANKPINEFCKYHSDLDTKYTYELIYLKELLGDQYIGEIKNPYDIEKPCNPDKSYIYASSKNDLSVNDNSQMEYKVCLVCGDKYSEECLSEEDDYYTFATTCKATYDSTGGTAYDGAWTDRDVYLSFGYQGEIRYGIDEYVYTIGGSAGGSVDANRQTYLANLKISKNVGAKEYKVQAFDGMNGKGNNVSCGTIRVDKAPITNVSVSISAKTTSGTKVNSDTWAMENVVLTANTNPGTSTSGYLYQWYKNGEKFGSQTTSNTLSVTGRGTYKVEVTNRVELAKGSAGKSVMSSDFIVKIDTKKPTCTLAVTSGTLGKNNIYVSDIAIAFASTGDKETDIDQGSGIVSQTIDYSKITDNVMNKVVTGTVKDAVGRTNTCTLTLSKDAVTPSTPTITVSDNVASDSWHKNNFTIKLSGASNVSQNEYYYSTNQSAVTNANVDSKSNVTLGQTITLNTNSSGTTYYYKVCSKAGKCSSVGSYVVKLDKNAPTCTLAVSSGTAGTNGWYKSNVVVKLNSNDVGSVVVSKLISNGSTSTSSNFTVTAEGQTSLKGTVTDSAGNVGTCSGLTISKDSIAPSCSVTKQNNTWTTSNVTVTFGCNDATSKCTSSTSSKSWTYNTGTISTKAESYTITDNAGNSATCSKTANVYLDKTAPSAPTTGAIGTVSGSNTTGTIQTVAGGSTDGGSGNITYKYLVTNSATAPANTNSGFTTSRNFTRSCGTSYYAWAIAVDKVGNISSVKSLGSTSDGANSYNAWGTCSKTCGGGTQTRTNSCALVTTNLSQSCNTNSCEKVLYDGNLPLYTGAVYNYNANCWQDDSGDWNSCEFDTYQDALCYMCPYEGKTGHNWGTTFTVDTNQYSKVEITYKQNQNWRYNGKSKCAGGARFDINIGSWKSALSEFWYFQECSGQGEYEQYFGPVAINDNKSITTNKVTTVLDFSSIKNTGNQTMKFTYYLDELHQATLDMTVYKIVLK